MRLVEDRRRGHEWDGRGEKSGEEAVGGLVVAVPLGEARVEHARVDEDHTSMSCLRG